MTVQILIAWIVTYQVSYETARDGLVECGHLPDRHASECSGNFDNQSTSSFSYDKNIYGASCRSCVPGRPPSVSLICGSYPAYRNTGCKQSTISSRRQNTARGLETQLPWLTVRCGKKGLDR